MTKDELIAEMALELAEYRRATKEIRELARNIRSGLYSIGAPLNDNILQYTNKQLVPFAKIGEQAEDIIHLVDETKKETQIWE